MRNYLRSIYSLLLLLLLFSQSVALLTKQLNHKSRRPNERVNYPSIQLSMLSMLSDIYITCVHAASSSSTLRVITQYFDISVRKKSMTKQKKNNSQNIDNKLKRFSISSWMTIAVPFFFQFRCCCCCCCASQRTIDNNNSFLVSRQRVAPPKQLSTVTCHICVSEPPCPPPPSTCLLFVFLKLV